MKKTLSLLFAVSFLTIIIVSVTGCNLFKPIELDEVKTTLKNAGYTVTVMTGDEYVETEVAVGSFGAYELEKYLYAVKGAGIRHIFSRIGNELCVVKVRRNFLTSLGIAGKNHILAHIAGTYHCMILFT